MSRRLEGCKIVAVNSLPVAKRRALVQALAKAGAHCTFDVVRP